MLKEGEGFAASAHACTESCMLEFDQGCADATIRQANWDASKVREKLRRDIDAHISFVRNVKLSELVARYQEKLRQSLSAPVESLFDAAGRDTWALIRKLLSHETETAESEFSTAISSFELDQRTIENMLQDLRGYARNLVVKKAREEAGKVLILMKDRFSMVFSHDKDSMPRVWTGKEDIKTITKDARTTSLRLLASMAAIRLDEKPDNIEKILFSSLMEGTETSPDPLAFSKWEEVTLENTLITPVQCKSSWRRFTAETEYTVAQAILAQEAYKRSNSWLPPLWTIVAMAILGYNEFMFLLWNPVYLLCLVVAYVLSKAMCVQTDVVGKFRHGTLVAMIDMASRFLPTGMDLLIRRLAIAVVRNGIPESPRQQDTLGFESFRNQTQHQNTTSLIPESSASAPSYVSVSDNGMVYSSTNLTRRRSTKSREAEVS